MSDNLFPADESPFEVLNSVPDAILLVNADGHIVYANDTTTELFGYQPDELRETTVEALVPEGLRDEHVGQRESYMDAPEPRPMGLGLDLVGQRKDGTTFPVEVSLTPITFDDNPAVMTVVRDISDWEAVRTKYQALLETAPDAFFIADATTGELIEVNDQAVELMGYSKNELVGMHQSQLHPRDEGDRYRDLFERHAEREGIMSELPDGSPIYVETKDGDHVPVEINVRIVDHGDQQLLTGTFRNLLERHERQKELRRSETIIQASGDAVYMLDRAGHFVFTNQALDQMAGYQDDELPGEHVSKVMGQSDIEAGEEVIRRLLQSDEERGTFEMDLLPASEQPIPTENHIAIIEADDGQLEASVGVVRDISKRQARERELEHQNQRLNEFAGVISHDLKNPLTIATGRLELALDEVDNEHLELVQSAHQRMNEIIQETLTLTREGQTVGETEMVDLANVIEQCWQHVASKGTDIHAKSMPTIQADGSRLQHLFENLFRNAIEHGGPNVMIEVGGLENGFYVEDDGPGIPASERETVFEAGYSSTLEGTGLGLAIVKAIVDAHDWDIRVEMGDSGGARFEITGVDVSNTS